MVTERGEASTPELRRRKLAMLAREHGLSREDRLDLASYMLRRDITTWRTLSDAQVSRLLDAFEGHELLAELERQRV